MKQNAHALPDEIKNSARFFAVAKNKTPLIKDWGNPENQTTWDKVNGIFGFDTCGHGIAPDYCFLDFDHILDDNGDYVNDSVRDFVKSVIANFQGNVYIEKSLSGHGLHVFLLPTQDKFETLSAGSKATLYFSDARGKDAPKLELFYKQKSRYCFVTGNKSNTGCEIPRGNEADSFLTDLISKINVQAAEYKARKASMKDAIKETAKPETPPELLHDLAIELWNYGNFADAERADWLPCISALKSLGFSFSEVKAMCENSERYDESKFEAEFNSLNDVSNYGIETLIGKCSGFDFKGFYRQWYAKHPQYKSSKKGELDSFELEKQAVLDDQFSDSEINKFDIPSPYVITKHGIKKIGKKDTSLICPRAILIKEKSYNLEDKTFKLTLEYINGKGKWRSITPQSREIILNKSKLIDLTALGLPIESGNVAKVVSWLSNFELENEDTIPVTYNVNRCGWYNYKGTDYFIDPRISNTVQRESRNVSIKVDSNNQMASDLTTAGTLEKWKEAYKLARKSTVARFNVAASLASALLKPLGERNFVCYTYGKTRSGKSTSLYLAASAVGNNGLVRVFDATTNGLTAAAMNTNHFSFFVDEKQSADAKLRANYQNFIYNDGNGKERTRADKNGNPRPVRTWTHITLCNGETMLLDDNATGGAFTRILQIAAPDEILDADTSKKIRKIISENYGHALPLFIQQLKKQNIDKLREEYEETQEIFEELCAAEGIELLPDYYRYIALVNLADQILNKALNINVNGDALNCMEIFKSLPSTDETDDASRAENTVNTFIAMKAAHFDGDKNRAPALDCYGRYKDDYLYIIATVLNDFLIEKGFTPSKVARDLTASGYFIPADKTADNKHKTPPTTIQVKINGKNQRCYKIKTENVDD